MLSAMSTFKKQQETNILDLAILKYIMQISNQTIKKLQIAITVPTLIENSVLYSLLTQEEIDLVKNVFPLDDPTASLYKNRVHSKHPFHLSGLVALRNSNEFPTIESENSSNTDIIFFEASVFKMLKVLYSYTGIHEMAEFHQMNISTQSSLFKHHLHYFMEYIISRMHMTPQEENKQNVYFKKIWNGHKNALKEIKELTVDLEALRESKEKEMKSVITQYRNDKTIIDRLNRKCSEDVQHVSNNYERKQYFVYKNWETKREELYVALEKIKTNFETLRNRNKNMTLNLDNRRFPFQSFTRLTVKIEAQLLALINQFDTEMEISQTEFDELNETYESDGIEKDSLKEAIKLQDSMYNIFLKDHQNASRTYLDEASEFLAG